MRNPNGYGIVENLGKRRRNPFRVRITTGWEYDPDTGKSKQKRATLGYYPSRKAALMALAEYNASPYDLDANKVTFEEIYNLWAKDGLKDLSVSSRRTYVAAFALTSPIHKMAIADIKSEHMQDIINAHEEKSNSTKQNIKKIFSRVFTYAMEKDIIVKDYSQFVKVAADGAQSEMHRPYSAEEIALLWENVDMELKISPGHKSVSVENKISIYPVDLILIMIYTGMRPAELLNLRRENIHLQQKYLTAGTKNPTSRDRVIPIHDEILPLVQKRYDEGGEYFVKYKKDAPPPYASYRLYVHDPILVKLNMDHLPHDGRHTFATFADKSGLDLVSIQRIMGHKSDSITKQVYTHKTISDLVEAVNKIKFK